MRIGIEDYDDKYYIFKICLGNKRKSGLYFYRDYTGINIIDYKVILTKDRKKAFRSPFETSLTLENLKFNLRKHGYRIICEQN